MNPSMHQFIPITEQVSRHNVRLVRVLYCDNGGILRGKALPACRLPAGFAEGIGLTLAMQAWSGTETLAQVEGMGPVGEVRLVPDPATFRIVPYAPNTAVMLADLLRLDRQPWGACPRAFLRRMRARLAQHGLTLRAGFEHEFYLARQTDDEGSSRYVPADDSRLFSTAGFQAQAWVLDEILAALEQQEILPALVHPEYGPGQQEVSIQPGEALEAADQVCLLRETIRGVALEHGLIASFAPKPFLEHAGSGAHVHLSLWGREIGGQLGANLFYDDRAEGSLSACGRAFIGGLLAHLPGLLALTCASGNSYQRLQPHAWSSAYACWGFDNREAAIRVPSPYWGREVTSMNVEVKCCDHSGNPYLALGGLIAAGLDGIERQREPGEPIQVDPGHLSAAERDHLGIQRLPTSLEEALAALEQDELLMEALGPQLSASYLAVKRAEIVFCQDKTPQAIALEHFAKY